MKKISYWLILFLGLFLIFWAISFYYYNPTVVRVESFGMVSRQLKLEISLIFFWGLLIAGIILSALGIYKLFVKRIIVKRIRK